MGNECKKGVDGTMKDPYKLRGEELLCALAARDKNKTCRTCKHDDDSDDISDICMSCGWTFRTKWEEKEPKQLTFF